MNWARTILDGIVLCVIFNAVVGLFFFVFPQAYSGMFPKGIKKAAAPYVKRKDVVVLYCILMVKKQSGQVQKNCVCPAFFVDFQEIIWYNREIDAAFRSCK